MARAQSITQLRAAVRKASTPEQRGVAEARVMERFSGSLSRQVHARNARLGLSNAQPGSEQARYFRAYAEALEAGL